VKLKDVLSLAKQFRKSLCLCLLLGAPLLALALPVNALIKLENTVAKTYATSLAVLTGKVEGVNAETRVVDVGILETLKGKSPGQRLRVQIAAPAELLKEIAPAQPLVFFLCETEGAGGAMIHLADKWLLANGIPNSNLQVWRVVQVHDTMSQSFPGRTAALVRLVGDLKAGKFTILDKWERKPFAGGVHKIAKLNVQKPSWIMAADINGDKKPALLAGSASGTRLLLATANGYEDATEQSGLSGSASGYHASGDIFSRGDGKLDLLLGDTLWISQGAGAGKRFVAAKAQLELPAKGQPLAAALADVTGDGKPDALLLSDSGELRIFANPGAPDKPWPLHATKTLWTEAETAGKPQAKAFAAFGDWGDDGKLCVMTVSETGIVRYALDANGGAPADLLRLTGADLRKNEKYRGGLKNVMAAALHMGESPRPDLFVLCDSGGLLLVNRGFGTYLLDDNAGAAFASGAEGQAGLKFTPATPWTPACLRGGAVDDLLVVGEDGTLYEVGNSPR